jgi:hypothetical protein
MPTVKTPVKLEDLSPEDRARLLGEAQAEKKAEGEQKAQAYQEALAAKMDPRDHLRNCPVGEGQAEGSQLRLEAYGHLRPAKPDQAIPAKKVTVVRCITCGGAAVLEQDYETFRQELDEGIED